MKRQKGFMSILVLALIGILIIGSGVYIYSHRSSSKVVMDNSIACQDFAALSDYVLKTIQKPDSSSDIQPNKSVISSFRWKRKQRESFITYPIIKGTEYIYGTKNIYRSNDFLGLAIKNNSDSFNQTINQEIKTLGFTTDSLNTLPFQSFSNQNSIRTFGFRKGNDLYSIVLQMVAGHQAPGQGIVSVACGKASDQYDKLYNALHFQSDQLVPNTYNAYNDYVQIADISPDNNVYALIGSSNHINIANYYSFNGKDTKLISEDSYPAKCETLESQKIGEGMRCSDKNYNERTVNYISTSSSRFERFDWGISFEVPISWQIKTNNTTQVILESITGENTGDTIKITLPQKYDVGTMSDMDAKFGNVTYQYYIDPQSQTGKWQKKVYEDNSLSGTPTISQATPVLYTPNNLPVFLGVGRWETYLIPLPYQDMPSRYLVFNISGSGDTKPLDDLIKTIK